MDLWSGLILTIIICIVFAIVADFIFWIKHIYELDPNGSDMFFALFVDFDFEDFLNTFSLRDLFSFSFNYSCVEIRFLLAITLIVFVAFFCFLYPSINIIINIVQDSILFKAVFQILREEFASGIAPLRVTSTMSGFAAISILTKYFFTAYPKLNETNFLTNYKSELDSLDSKCEIQLTRSKIVHTYINLTQTALAQSSMLVLWICYLLKIAVWSMPLLSYIIFYFIDDWNIIVAYSSALKGRFLKGHVYKLFGIDFLWILLSAICAYHVSPYFMVGVIFGHLILSLALVSLFRGELDIF